MGRLSDAPATVEVAAAPRLFEVAGLDRRTGPTVVKLRLASAVSIVAMEQSIQQVLGEMRLERQQASLEGLPLGKAFSLRFVGSQNFAASRSTKFLPLQHVGSVWRHLTSCAC
jgi:hypothetical protein